MSTTTLPVDSWREAGAILDHAAYPLRSLCVTADGMVLVLDGDDPLGPGQVVCCHRAELADQCWTGAILRGTAPPPVQRQALAPTGYGDLLRMIGTFATMAGWEWLRLVMGSRRMLISYVCDGRPGEELLTPESVYTHLNEAFLRRAPGSAIGATDRTRPTQLPASRYAAVEYPAISYAERLAALGRHAARQTARAGAELYEVLVEELIDDQMLFAYRVVGGMQLVGVVDHGAMMALCAEHRSPRGARAAIEALSELGAHLDAADARSVSLHQRSHGDFVLSFTVHSGGGYIGARERIRTSWALGQQLPLVDLSRQQ